MDKTTGVCVIVFTINLMFQCVSFLTPEILPAWARSLTISLETEVLLLFGSMFIPHALYLVALDLTSKRRTDMLAVLWFEVGFVLAGLYILAAWVHDPSATRAEPIFVLLGVAVASFEYLDRFVDRHRQAIQSDK